MSGPLALNLRHGACWNEYWNTERSSFSLFDTNSVGNVSNSRIHEAEGEGGRGGGREGEVEGGRGGERNLVIPCHGHSIPVLPELSSFVKVTCSGFWE